jgi:formylglycine-generating enzyme required for sulfatase activity
MSSVLRHRYSLQWSLSGFLVLALVGLLGCQPVKNEKKTPAAKAPAATPADHAAKHAEPAASELPGVDAPVNNLPEAKPAKKPEPAKESQPIAEPKAEPKTSAQPSPITPKVANQADGAESNPTMDPTVKWLPKAQANPTAEAKDQAGMKPYTETIPGTEVKFEMMPIPGGTFKMGSPSGEGDRKDDEGPQVDVKINPFWMEAHEVTWDEYELWGLGLDQQRRKAQNIESTAWDKTADALTIPTKPYADMTFGMGKSGYPAVCMTQFAAKMYCKWLSAKTGRYYRLPTEAEWEYACRAGAANAYSFGDDAKKLDDYGWYEGNSDEKYQKVGKKKPNAWGLYDMHGNVAELCLDQYVADRYKQLGGGAIDNPVLPVTKLYPQVARGGAWTDEAPLLRSAARRGSSRDWKAQDPQIPQSIWYFTDANFVGFRVVRPMTPPTPEEAARYELTDFEKEELIDYKKAQAGKQ